MRKTIRFSITDIAVFRNQCLSWAEGFNHFALLDSNNLKTEKSQNLIPSSFNMLIAAGTISALPLSSNLSDLNAFISNISDWSFGHLSFNLQSETEGIESAKQNKTGFPNIFFFQPKWVIQVGNDLAELYYPEFISEKEARAELDNLLKPANAGKQLNCISQMQCQCTREQYIEDINALQSHIARGNIYEINYCLEFFATDSEINPYSTYVALQEYSPAPFSAFYKHYDKFLLSSSPERYLKKVGNTIISQPIKGTIARGKNEEADIVNRNELHNNPKERSENIMIADLVRNDLSRIALPGSVKVNELCGVYSYKYVHQLITTISAELAENKTVFDTIYQTFPMGSMTGAPKHSALKLIAQYEHFNRGLFSGSVGYFSPAGNFDFNVIIRSILYNKNAKYLSIPAGSAITAYSIPEKEYDECLLKAGALLQVLQ